MAKATLNKPPVSLATPTAPAGSKLVKLMVIEKGPILHEPDHRGVFEARMPLKPFEVSQERAEKLLALEPKVVELYDADKVKRIMDAAKRKQNGE